MIEDIQKDAQSRMKKSLESLDSALKKTRTGRAHPSLLDGIHVSYYGSDTPLNQVANISVEEGRTLIVSPFDKSLVPDVEKAIMTSDLGLNPSTAGTGSRAAVIRRIHCEAFHPLLVNVSQHVFQQRVRKEVSNILIS